MKVRASILALSLLFAAEVAAQTVVPVRPIRVHSMLVASDLTVEDGSTPGALTDINSAVGREAKVTLYTGRPILESQVGSPAVVERNQLVRMNFVSGPLRITAEGRALDRAGVGETIRVMNLTSKQAQRGYEMNAKVITAADEMLSATVQMR